MPRPSLQEIFGESPVESEVVSSRPSLDEIFAEDTSPQTGVVDAVSQLKEQEPVTEPTQPQVQPPPTAAQAEETAGELGHDIVAGLQKGAALVEEIPGFGLLPKTAREFEPEKFKTGVMTGLKRPAIGLYQTAFEMMGDKELAEAARKARANVDKEYAKAAEQAPVSAMVGELLPEMIATAKLGGGAATTTAGKAGMLQKAGILLKEGVKVAGLSGLMEGAMGFLEAETQEGDTMDMVSKRASEGLDKGKDAAAMALATFGVMKAGGGLYQTGMKVKDAGRKLIFGATPADLIESIGKTKTKADRYVRKMLRGDKWMTEIDDAFKDLAMEARAKSPAGRSVIESRFNNRASKSSRRIAERINQEVSGKPYFDNIDEVEDFYRSISKDGYKEFYLKPPIRDGRLEAFMDDKNIKEASDKALELVSSQRRSKAIKEGSTFVAPDRFDPEVLDNTNQVLNNDTLKAHRNVNTGTIDTKEGRVINGIRKDFLGIVDENAPEFKVARGLQSDKFSIQKAQADAKKWIGSQKTGREIEREVSKYTAAEIEAGKVGAAEAMRDMVERGANTGVQAKRLVGTAKKGGQFKPYFMEIDKTGKKIFNQKSYDRFMKAMSDEVEMGESMNFIIRGSQTQPKGKMAAMFKRGMIGVKKLSEAVDIATGGIVSTLTDRYIGLTKGNAAQIAKLITSQENMAQTLKAIAKKNNPAQIQAVRDLIYPIMKKASVGAGLAAPEVTQTVMGAQQ